MNRGGTNLAVTQKRIAELLGIDRTTVTKALSDNPTVSGEMRARVQALCKELGYRPNYHSRSLRTRETRVLSVLKIGLGLSHLHSIWISHIQKWAFEEGYKIRLESMPDIGTTLAEQSSDGFISFHGPSELPGPSVHGELQGLPVVFTDCGSSEYPDNTVVMDNQGGGAQVARHLVEEGHERIAFLGMVGYSGVCRDRRDGLIRQLNDLGVSMPGNRIIGIPAWIEEPDEVLACRGELERLVATGVTAVVASSDTAAAGAIKALKGMGLSVPGDMAVTGFDDSLVARVCDPAITSVRQDVDTAAKAAIEMLLTLIREGGNQPRVVVPTQLAVRESTTKG